MENILVTAGELKQSGELHAAFERAQRQRQAAQPTLDRLQLEYEDAAMRLLAAERSAGTPAARLADLQAERDRREGERDRATREADAPLIAAREALIRHDGRFVTAASGWLDSIRREYGHDVSLSDFIIAVRRELEVLQRRLASLSEIDACFRAARDKVEGWKPWVPETKQWTVSGKYPTTMRIPRLADWLDRS